MPEPDSDLSSCRVLVVDDIEMQRMLIGSFLADMGVGEILFAVDGVDGLARAQEVSPDLVVLDIEMPRMNGLEMLKRMRAIERLAAVPVIVQSGTDSLEARESVFQAGATDFITKPLYGSEFQARTRVHLENRLNLRRVSEYLALITQELEDAAYFQRALLPSARSLARLELTHRLAIDSLFAPSSQLGGDFWGLLRIDRHAVGVYICDFAGHGVSAAMNTFQLHALMSRLDPPDRHDPAAFAVAVNRSLQQSLRQRQYATFCVAIIDLEDEVLRYAAGACPDPVLGRRGREPLTMLDGSGMPLGMLPEISVENREVAFPPGSFLFLYSDALPETKMPDGTVGGVKLVQALTAAISARPFSAGALSEKIFGNWPANAKPSDDLTLVWIERTGK
jgi:sigma-B regulation protein RsbU (phosphoserine phosphatase)